MADSEFEEFRHHFERIPQHIRAAVHTYTLVPDILLEDSPTSSKSNESADEPVCLPAEKENFTTPYPERSETVSSEGSPESLEAEPWMPRPPAGRRRRRLPEIPKHKKPYTGNMSLADELGDALHLNLDGGMHPRNILMMKYLRDEDLYGYDVDSGNSTAHSPDGPKSQSPVHTDPGLELSP